MKHIVLTQYITLQGSDMVRFMFYKDLSGHKAGNRLCRGSGRNVEIPNRKLFQHPGENSNGPSVSADTGGAHIQRRLEVGTDTNVASPRTHSLYY